MENLQLKCRRHFRLFAGALPCTAEVIALLFGREFFKISFRCCHYRVPSIPSMPNHELAQGPVEATTAIRNRMVEPLQRQC